ncbi:MAG: stage 0 sporulation protein J, partial [Thermomicrobium sp.]|nr:stage 0 sporulation protein J [Thermomicrobium sp.]
ARALLSLGDLAAQVEALRLVRERGLTVRQTEELVRRWTANHRARRRATPPLPLDVERATNALQHRLRTKVELRPSTRGGRLIIHFSTPDDLQRLLAELLGQTDEIVMIDSV